MQVLFMSENFIADFLSLTCIFVGIILVICLIALTISTCRLAAKKRRFFENATKKLSKKKAKVELTYED